MEFVIRLAGQREEGNEGRNWWFFSPPAGALRAPVRVVESVRRQAELWMSGLVEELDERLRVRGDSPPVGFERLGELSSGVRVVNGLDLGVALEVEFVQRLEGGLEGGDVGALHPLFWFAFGLLVRRVEELHGREMSAEELESELENAVWDGVEGRIPLRVPGWERTGWVAVGMLEERGQVPTGVRQGVVDLIEMVMRVHEETAGEPVREVMVARRESILV